MVPAAIVVSLALLGIAGGFAGFGALGQALAGPGVPREVAVSQASSRAVPPVVRGHRAALLARSSGSHAVGAETKVVSAKPGASHAGAAGAGPGVHSSGGGAAASQPTPGGSTPGSPSGGGGSSPSTPSTTSSPVPGTTPSSPVSGVTKTVTHVAKKVTSPLPPSVTKPVKKIVKKVTRRLPPLPGLP